MPIEVEQILTRFDVTLRPDPSRTVLKPFAPSDPAAFAHQDIPRGARIARRVLELDEQEAAMIFDVMREALQERHPDFDDALRTRLAEIEDSIGVEPPSEAHALLIASYFLQEYSFEAAALFNPSIVPAPDQSGCEANGIRFAMSLRGIGEGHISSVTFRSGTWVPGKSLTIDPPTGQAATPIVEGPRGADENGRPVTLRWRNITDISELVIFPVLDSSRQGLEDARFVKFTEDDGTSFYYATVTAFSGSEISGQLIRADGLETFVLTPLKGKAAANKGMALFPRKIDGRYMMLGRQDNENLWLLASDNLDEWDNGEKLLTPKYWWESVQIGNCGSPIEIEEGWLVLTHGVGPARVYSIGACLLDKADPSKVLGRMKMPLLHPSDQERDGYVPNVVYSCGGMVHDRTLLLPYGVADSLTRFATGSVDDILAAME